MLTFGLSIYLSRKLWNINKKSRIILPLQLIKFGLLQVHRVALNIRNHLINYSKQKLRYRPLPLGKCLINEKTTV